VPRVHGRNQHELRQEYRGRSNREWCDSPLTIVSIPASAKARIAASTAESYMFTLRAFFNWCVKENLCRRNPVLDEVQLDRIDRKGRTLFADFDLAQRLIENAPNDDLRYVLFCGFHTGMRKLEIIEAVPERLAATRSNDQRPNQFSARSFYPLMRKHGICRRINAKARSA
jgi:hypothetical protein